MRTTKVFGSVLAGFLCFIQCLSAQTKDAGLVLHYDFSEGSGNTLHDKGGNGYHGTIGPFVGGWVKAGSGHALEFEGEMVYPQRNATAVICPSDAGLEMKLSDWTIAVLVKVPHSATNAGMFLVHKGGYSDGYPGYSMGISGPDNAKILWASMITTRATGQPGRYAYKGTSGDYKIADGQWHHVTAVYNRQKDLQMYMDGKPSGKLVDISSLKDVNVEDIVCHEGLRVYGGLVGAAACSIADVAIYRKALSPQAVKQMSDELLKKVADEIK